MTAHLIHVGLPKAGSTFLQCWFAAHPQFAYQGGGLAGFRDVNGIGLEAATPNEETKWRVTSSEALSAPRADAGRTLMYYNRTGREPMAEEQARACHILAALFAGATILLITRGFRTVLLSGYSEFVRNGGSASLTKLLEGPQHDYPWNYDWLICLYRAAFGTDKVIVLPFEMLRDSPECFLREIETRLGLEHFPYSAPPVNVGASALELTWYPILTRAVRIVAGEGRPLENLYIRLLYGGRLGFAARLLQRLAPQSEVSSDLIDDAVIDRFRGTATLLRELTSYQPYRADYLL